MLNVFTFSSFTHAHSEKDKARYVATTGIDQGLCDNPIRPCKTLSFGLSKASKGDRVLLAAGEYHLDSLDEVLAFKSRIVPVLGGFNRFDHYSNQSPGTNITRLSGIPSELAEYARKQGFSVLRDGKSKFTQQKINSINEQYALANTSQASAVCENQKAGGFTCNKIDLVGHVAISDFSSNPKDANDIWGHIDLNTNIEYAIIGIENGVAVFDLSDPTTPREVGSIAGTKTLWRDVKVYQYFDKALNIWQAYAYATIDGKSDNVMIIDLNQLPQSISLVTKDAAAAQAHNVYISNVDYTYNTALKNATPTLQLVGAKGGGAQSNSFLSYSLINPKKLTPYALGDNFGSGYTHDATSMRISDSRKDIDCKENGDTCDVFIDFNEEEIKIWNTTTPGQEKQISQIIYNDVQAEHKYVHSGWMTEDKRFVLAHDEFDELRGGVNTTVRIFDLQSLTNPTLAGVWKGATPAIDHNGFVRGNRYYMSNYKRGLTILDITNPASPVEVGLFDTYSPNDLTGFAGAWGVYPYLPSGLILVSDINGGLFVLRDNTNNTPQGSLSFTAPNVEVQPGVSIDIDVSRIGGFDENITVGWELLPGSATPNDDYTDVSGVLTWSADEKNNKTISIDIANNLDINEVTEKFFVRLFNPTNGATLSSPSYFTVNIEGKKVPGTIGFELDAIDVNENNDTLSLRVFRIGGTDGALSVDFTTSNGSALANEDFAQTNGTLSWAAGNNDSQTITISITDDSTLEDDESFNVQLTANGTTNLSTNAMVTVTIKDNEKNQAPVVTISEDFEVNTGQTSKLTSTATDPEGDSLTYQWSQTSGTTVSIVNDTMNEASFVSPTQASTLVFKLVVTDSRGEKTEKSVNVNVKAPIVTPPAKDNSSSSSGSIPISLVFFLSAVLLIRRKVAQ